MKILIIDDHALFRDGLLLMLGGLSSEIESFEAGSFESASKIMQSQPDLEMILLDLCLPGISYIDALKAIRLQLPDAIVVILSGTEDYKMVELALQNGARGYIPKSSSAAIMLNALQLVISGGTYLPVQILQKNSALSGNKLLSAHSLTPRQYDVLQYLKDGLSNKEIGCQLGLTESTVRAHVAAILKNLNVANRTRAVQVAQQNNWV